MEKQDLLKLRKKIKAKKPNFIRQDAHKKAEISKKWRRPKGLHSKMRLHKKGYRKSPSKGYRAPAIIRGLHESGLLPVIIYSKKDIEQLDDKKEGAVIAKAVGIKKRIELINYTKEKGIRILNIKDIDKFLTKINERLKKRKEEKEKKQKEKEEKEKKKKIAKAKKKEDLAEKLTEEERKEKEKKEQDKLLIKKEAQ
ncbi:50S ribosomal protein L32e [Candidatus Woesearchaeota archaeon]|nr:50S ribosomal protein L32e [Candidatus Woesearchaeota archaeon]